MKLNKKNKKNLTLDEIQSKELNFDRFYDADKNKIDVGLKATILKGKCNIRLGHNRLYRLKRQIEFHHHPQLFEILKKPNVETTDAG